VRYGSRKTAVTRYDRPDGALWFTEQSSGKIGRITTGGVITEVVSGGSDPLGMTAGPDRALWFMLFHNSAIARAPACALGLTAGFDSRFARNTLRAAFERGVARILVKLWIVPECRRRNLTSTLSTGSGVTLCSEWTTVNSE
jgi:hypothetical protein